MAFYPIGAGIVGGLLAAVFGAIDFLAIPHGTRAQRIGAIHGVGNVIVVALFAISWLLSVGRPVVSVDARIPLLICRRQPVACYRLAWGRARGSPRCGHR